MTYLGADNDIFEAKLLRDLLFPAAQRRGASSCSSCFDVGGAGTIAYCPSAGTGNVVCAFMTVHSSYSCMFAALNVSTFYSPFLTPFRDIFQFQVGPSQQTGRKRGIPAWSEYSNLLED
jgi:hypothetical protein